MDLEDRAHTRLSFALRLLWDTRLHPSPSSDYKDFVFACEVGELVVDHVDAAFVIVDVVNADMEVVFC